MPERNALPMRDVLARYAYSDQLVEAAEKYLLSRFDGDRYSEASDEAVVSAAMTITCGLCWEQPTDAQLEFVDAASGDCEDLDAETDEPQGTRDA